MKRHDSTRYLDVRSILESPLLDGHKWAKAKASIADALYADLEDSAAPERKGEALDRALEILAARDDYQVPLVVRPNPLDSDSGRDEIAAVAKAGVETLTYPKLRNGDELREVVELLNTHGADPDILAIIETIDAVANIDDILDVPQVVGAVFGPGDLAGDLEIELHDDAGRVLRDPFTYARSRLVIAAARRGLARFDIAFVRDLRDLDAVRAEVAYSRSLGFTGMALFYPMHLQVIHDEFAPKPSEIEWARRVVDTYKAALDRGDAAVLLDGRALLVHDYHKALRILGSEDGQLTKP